MPFIRIDPGWKIFAYSMYIEITVILILLWCQGITCFNIPMFTLQYETSLDVISNAYWHLWANEILIDDMILKLNHIMSVSDAYQIFLKFFDRSIHQSLLCFFSDFYSWNFKQNLYMKLHIYVVIWLEFEFHEPI